MKTLILAFFLVLAAQFSFSQQIDLVGQWHMVNIKQVAGGQTRSMEDEFKKGTIFLDFYFMQEGKFKQSGNAAGDGKVSTQEGTWKLTGNKLINSINYEGRTIDVDYQCEIKGDTLMAKRTNPSGSMSIINIFVKAK